MKQALIFAAIVLAFVNFNCKAKSQEPKPAANVISVTLDTTIAVPVKNFLTAPRYSCSGQRLNQNKVVGISVDSVKKHIQVTKTVFCGDTTAATPSKDKVKVAGASTTTFFPEWLKNLIWILVALALLALLLWFLWWLFSKRPERSSTLRKFVSSDNETKPQATTTPTAPDFIAATSLFTTETSGSKETIQGSTGYEGVILLVRQLQKSGGNVQWGDLYIDIPEQNTDVFVSIDNNQGHIAGKGVEINITNENAEISAPSTHYHKTTGGAKSDDQQKTDQQKKE